MDGDQCVMHASSCQLTYRTAFPTLSCCFSRALMVIALTLDLGFRGQLYRLARLYTP